MTMSTFYSEPPIPRFTVQFQRVSGRWYANLTVNFPHILKARYVGIGKTVAEAERAINRELNKRPGPLLEITRRWETAIAMIRLTRDWAQGQLRGESILRKIMPPTIVEQALPPGIDIAKILD
jgi:hypothetical protein